MKVTISEVEAIGFLLPAATKVVVVTMAAEVQGAARKLVDVDLADVEATDVETADETAVLRW